WISWSSRHATTLDDTPQQGVGRRYRQAGGDVDAQIERVRTALREAGTLANPVVIIPGGPGKPLNANHAAVDWSREQL
ncbi:hypothetical protein Q6254_28340, partial [Klebsiella pneumoniae]|nr:hypothetical protein [Klebsiella pneumoniae]